MKAGNSGDVVTENAARSAATQREEDENALPVGWEATDLGALGKWSSGGTPSRKRKEYFGGGVPWVLTGDLPDGLITNVPNSITEEGLEHSSAKPFPPGTLLIAMYGATIGKLGLLSIEAATNQACAALLPNKGNSASMRFIYYYLLSNREALKKAGKGGAQPNISQTVLKSLPIRLPPLNEQYRIVEKIDTLFAELDQGEAALQQTLTLLGRYRQSLLKAAVTGSLTREWREQHTANTETGEQLLDRILTARRQHWEADQLAKMQAKGKPPKTDAWKKKYKQPTAPDTTNLPELPDSWTWASVDQLLKAFITGPFGSALHKSDYIQSGIPLVNPSNLLDGKIIPDAKKAVDEETIERLQRYKLKTGDIVIARRGEMGRCAAVQAKENGWLCGTGSMILRPTEVVNPDYLSATIRSQRTVSYLETNSVGTTMKNLNQRTLLAAPIAVPCLEEQIEVMQRLAASFEQINQLETHCQTELARSKALRQSILKDAFAGKLVPQDPNDEPASDLLARIRAERGNP